MVLRGVDIMDANATSTSRRSCPDTGAGIPTEATQILNEGPLKKSARVELVVRRRGGGGGGGGGGEEGDDEARP